MEKLVIDVNNKNLLYYEWNMDDLALSFNVIILIAMRYWIDLSDCLCIDFWNATFHIPDDKKYNPKIVENFEREIFRILNEGDIEKKS